MSTKIKTDESEPTVEVDCFSKEQILSSNKYIHRKDVVNVVLNDGQSYSLKDVDELIEKFMKEKVN